MNSEFLKIAGRRISNILNLPKTDVLSITERRISNLRTNEDFQIFEDHRTKNFEFIKDIER